MQCDKRGKNSYEHSKLIKKRVLAYSEKLNDNPKLKAIYQNACYSTWQSALEKCEDNTYFVLTGDIPAMWLRDSAAQITHYLPLAQEVEVSEVFEGVLRRQLQYIQIDPYANAFNKENNGHGHTTDLPRQSGWVWERKYEVDSLCYPMRLLYLYWKQTGKSEIIQQTLPSVAKIILDQWKIEQHHFEKSPYYFIRENTHPTDTIPNGKGTPVSYTGMTWSGFRPSDDGCQYGYLTASNMFAVVVLGYMSEMLRDVCREDALANECDALRKEIKEGIEKYCIVEHPKYGKIYVCETDGMGHYSMFDDANIPSLLSIPYIGYLDAKDEIYQNTRKFLLSEENPYYFEGKYAKGIGSCHTPDRYVWHMALVMQAMTSLSDTEKRELVEMIVNTDADTGYLHEGFCMDNPFEFTREWFTWPNSLFAELIEHCINNHIL